MSLNMLFKQSINRLGYWFAGILLGTLAYITPVFAQNEVTLQFLDELPQSTYRNPVTRPSHNFSIGLPFISSLHGAYRNSAFSLADITYKRRDTTIIDMDKVLSQMASGSNYIYFNTGYDLLHLGFKVKNTWWQFNISDQLETHLSLPGDLARLAWKGNLSFAKEGRAADFSSFNLKANHYREFGLLMQFERGAWLIGVKPKLLFGLSHASTTRANVTLQTDTSNPFTLQAKTDFELRTSTGVFDTKGNNSSLSGQGLNYLFNFRNPGLAADLGVRYQPKDSKWDFAANVNNVGFIYWTTNTRTYTGSTTPIDYKGVSFKGFIQNDQFVGINALGDSMKKAVGYAENANAFTSFLTAQGTINGQYHLKDWVSFGAALNAWEFQGLRTAFQLNSMLKYNRLVGMGLSYTLQNGRADNVGLGVYIKPGPFQLYLVSDNVLGFIKPENTRNTNIRAGLNLVFRAKQDKDGDGIEDKKDRCPDAPGPAATKGCPDRDLDGLPDIDDKCPNDPGPIEKGGCPDRDGDGIVDSEDACPDKAGTLALKGCPDRDKDGVTDAADLCPDSAGLAYLQGCPDLDGDSIPNYKDKCPTVKGPKSNNGCPIVIEEPKDTIVPVKIEPVKAIEPVLPKEPIIQDSDNDGLPDNLDDCPKTPGPASNKGCPELKATQKAILTKAFKNLEFDFNKATIRPKSLPSLAELAKLLTTDRNMRLTLAGHTDNVGNPKANLDLSKRRTLAVQAYLLKNGALREQIITNWYGDTKPIASNKTPQGRTKNRRVEMKLLYQ